MKILHPGANPTTASYNASVVKIYNASVVKIYNDSVVKILTPRVAYVVRY
jgi:hypothetical protein